MTMFAERRELKCEPSIDGKTPGKCLLFKRKDDDPYTTTCIYDNGKYNLFKIIMKESFS